MINIEAPIDGVTVDIDGNGVSLKNNESIPDSADTVTIFYSNGMTRLRVQSGN